MLNNNCAKIPDPAPYFRPPQEAEPCLLLRLRHPAEERAWSGGSREVLVLMFGAWVMNHQMVLVKNHQLAGPDCVHEEYPLHTRVHIVCDVSHTN